MWFLFTCEIFRLKIRYTLEGTWNNKENFVSVGRKRNSKVLSRLLPKNHKQTIELKKTESNIPGQNPESWSKEHMILLALVHYSSLLYIDIDDQRKLVNKVLFYKRFFASFPQKQWTKLCAISIFLSDRQVISCCLKAKADGQIINWSVQHWFLVSMQTTSCCVENANCSSTDYEDELPFYTEVVISIHES